MFCPVCKAEYRPGFRRCSNCNVPLVDSIASRKNARADSGESSRAKPELLWKGTDPALSGLIACALDAAEIPYHQATRDFNLIPGLSEPVHAFFVPARDGEAARAVLKSVLSRHETDDVAPSDS